MAIRLSGGVSQKLLIPILSSVLIFIVVSTLFWKTRYENSLRDSFTHQLEIVEAFASQPLSSALYTFDANLANKTLKGLDLSDGTQYARVLISNRDGSTEIFAEWKKDSAEIDIWPKRLSAFSEIDDTTLVNKNWRLTQIPLSSDGIELGFLEIATETLLIESAIDSANSISLLFGTLSFLMIGSLIYGTSRGVTRPIEQLVDAVDQLGAGNLAFEIRPSQRKDELGKLGKSLEGFRDTLIHQKNLHLQQTQTATAQAQAIKEIATGLNRMADGNFADRISCDFPKEYIKLKDDLNRTLIVLSASFAALRDSSETVSLNTNAISSAANDLAIRTERSAAELESAARAIADLNAAVLQTVQSVGDVSNLVERTRTSSEENQIVMNDATAAMAEIESRSNQIKSIVSLIDDIAFQTNLLALNAGVEAARAGDAGAGFAVVASEVRALAHRSSEAAGEITNVINQSTKSVENGTILVTQAGQNLTEMSGSIATIMERMNEISTTTKRQSDRIQAMNGTVQHLDGDMQQNAAMFEETSATSEILSAEARALHDEIAQYRVGNSRKDDMYQDDAA